MNSLLLTLSLAFLVIVPAYSDNSILSNVENLSPEEQKQMAETMRAVVFEKVKEKCINQTGNEEAFNKIEESLGNTLTCFTDFLNTTELQIEIEREAPRGNLEVVFNKYCLNRTIILTCIDNFATSFTPCLNDTEISKKDVLVKVIKRLIEFVCYKDGDQIALFLSENGPECLQSHQTGLGDCINRSFSKYVTPNGEFIVDEVGEVEQCQELRDLQVCAVTELEKCAQSTPANLVDAMFKSILNETSCTINKAGNLNAPVILLGTILMALITKFLMF